MAQESTWRWLTAQHISDFYASAYTRDDPPNTCLTLCEGHRPKMFLWMVEEFAFILCHLHKDDRDGALVLGHKLLLLAHSHCCRKRGSCHAQAQPHWIGCPCAPSKPWSMQCWCQTLFSWSAWHGQCLTILWDQVKHHHFPDSKHTIKSSNKSS